MSLSDGALDHLRRVLGDPRSADDRYQIGEPVGRGGMGIVYRAYDRVLDRQVALKVLHPHLADPGAAARLEREARILARLVHPGIVPVHDAGTLEWLATLADGRLFYVMKLVRGRRLEEFVRDIPLAERLRVFLRICEAVGFAHTHGVVHRDLKPSNVMVGAFGQVLVLDWGIARLLRGASSPVPSASPESSPPAAPVDAGGGGVDTAPGSVLGTPGFMAPEQAHGWPHLVDERTDVYALGAMLRSLAGAGGPAAVPRPLSSIWARALDSEPDRRYPSAAALAADVTRFLDGEAVEAHRETAGERVGRIFRKYQTAIILVLTYLAIRFLFLATRGV